MTKNLLEKIKEMEKTVGKNWLTEFQNVKTAQEIINIAKTHNIILSEAVAEEAFKLLNDEEISDEQLTDISGGGLCPPLK